MARGCFSSRTIFLLVCTVGLGPNKCDAARRHVSTTEQGECKTFVGIKNTHNKHPCASVLRTDECNQHFYIVGQVAFRCFNRFQLSSNHYCREDSGVQNVVEKCVDLDRNFPIRDFWLRQDESISFENQLSLATLMFSNIFVGNANASVEPSSITFDGHDAKFIASGADSSVWRLTGGFELAAEPVVVKMLRNSADTATFRNELQVLIRDLPPHPNIMRPFGWVDRSDIQTQLLFVPLTDGDLRRLVAGTVEPEYALEIALQMLRAITMLEQHDLVHGDVKPENFLLKIGPPVQVLLIDFGATEKMEILGKESSSGTAAYQGPESAHLRGKAEEEKARLLRRTDVFAAGLVVYEMIVGSLPAWQRNPTTGEAHYWYARNLDIDTLTSSLDVVRSKDGAPWTATLQKILAGMLHPDPLERWSAQESSLEITFLREQLNARRSHSIFQRRFREALTSTYHPP